MPTFTWSDLFEDVESAQLVDVMTRSELFESKGAVRRLVQQGGVKINSVKQDDPGETIERPKAEMIFQAGKRIFFKLLG